MAAAGVKDSELNSGENKNSHFESSKGHQEMFIPLAKYAFLMPPYIYIISQTGINRGSYKFADESSYVEERRIYSIPCRQFYSEIYILRISPPHLVGLGACLSLVELRAGEK